MTIRADPFAQGFYESMGAVCVGSTRSDAIPGRRLPLMVYDVEAPAPARQ